MCFSLLIGALFLLPSLVQIAKIGSYAEFSTFSARSPTPVVWDETFLYGAEANYMLTRSGAPAYDDTWEHRKAVYPYSILPIAVEALTAKYVGGLKTAIVLLKFLFPALNALLFLMIYTRCGADTPLAALLSLLTLVLSFSPRTLLLGDRAFLLHGHGARVVDLLQSARTPNPNLTLPLLLVAVICLARANQSNESQKNSLIWAATAGLVGSLLFYSYIYYAIAWCATVGLLSVLALFKRRAMSRSVWLTLIVSGAGAIPFLMWKHLANKEGSYLARSTRLGLVNGHALYALDLTLTLAWGLVTLACALVWWWLRQQKRDESYRPARNYLDALMPVLVALMLGAFAGMNMQAVTGFNIQAAHHYSHMVLQPVGLLMICALGLQIKKPRRGVVLAMLALVYAACAAAQVEAARDSVEYFRVTPTEQKLFAWLNANSATGSVVATDNLELSILLPDVTHNSILFSEGSRSTASDQELMERFLLVSRLSGASAEQVSEELSSSTAKGIGVASYTYYMFETSTYEEVGVRRTVSAQIPGLLQWFGAMNLEDELRRFRVDYLWTENGRTPPAVAGWRWRLVLTGPQDPASQAGQLWQLVRE